MKKYLLQKHEKQIKHVCELTEIEKEYFLNKFNEKITVPEVLFNRVEVEPELEEGVEIWDENTFEYSQYKTYAYTYTLNLCNNKYDGVDLIKHGDFFRGFALRNNEIVKFKTIEFNDFIKKLKEEGIRKFYEFDTFAEFCEWYLKKEQE